MKQMSTSLLCCKLLSARDLNTPIAYLVPIPIRKPNCSSVIQFTAVTLPSILLVRILSIIFDTCNVRLIVRKSRQSVAFAFFSSEIITVCKKITWPFPCHVYLLAYLHQLCRCLDRDFNISPGISSPPSYFPFFSSFNIVKTSSFSKICPRSSSSDNEPLSVSISF